MQMFANDPQYIVEDMLKGYAKAHSDIVAPTDNPRAVSYTHLMAISTGTKFCRRSEKS